MQILYSTPCVLYTVGVPSLFALSAMPSPSQLSLYYPRHSTPLLSLYLPPCSLLPFPAPRLPTPSFRAGLTSPPHVYPVTHPPFTLPVTYPPFTLPVTHPFYSPCHLPPFYSPRHSPLFYAPRVFLGHECRHGRCWAYWLCRHETPLPLRRQTALHGAAPAPRGEGGCGTRGY